MSRWRKALMMLVAALMLAVGGVATDKATVAHADLAASQISFIDNYGYIYFVCIYGYNQYDSYVGNCFSTPGYQTYLSSWWWADASTVDVELYDRYWNHQGTEWTQPDPDYWSGGWTGWWCYQDDTQYGWDC